MRRRAVITGIGLATPMGNGVRQCWDSMVAGRSGIGVISLFDATGLSVRIAGEVRDLPLADYVPPERSRKMPRAAKLAVVAAHMALRDSGLRIEDRNRGDIDLFLGVACPDVRRFARVIGRRIRKGSAYVDPTVLTAGVTTAPAGHVSVELGIAGESITFSTGCSSSTNAIGHALRKIRGGEGTIIFAGGAEAGVQFDFVAAYANAGALSTRNDDPTAASRPFDADRDGHVLSEASAILILEEYEHARKRGARVYAELLGYGATSDCHSMFSVGEDERNAARCISKALASAKRNAGEVDYHNAHGSSGRDADKRETRMLKMALKEHAYRVPVSSIKSMAGHPFGASGALQTATCALAIHHNVIPPTINYEEPDPECDLDYVPNCAREAKVDLALNYALGMGGNNAALALASV